MYELRSLFLANLCGKQKYEWYLLGDNNIETRTWALDQRNVYNDPIHNVSWDLSWSLWQADYIFEADLEYSWIDIALIFQL